MFTHRLCCNRSCTLFSKSMKFKFTDGYTFFSSGRIYYKIIVKNQEISHSDWLVNATKIVNNATIGSIDAVILILLIICSSKSSSTNLFLCIDKSLITNHQLPITNYPLPTLPINIRTYTIILKITIFHINNSVGNIKDPIIVGDKQNCTTLFFC